MLLVAVVSLFVAAAPTATTAPVEVEYLEDIVYQDAECESESPLVLVEEEEEVLESQEIVFDQNIDLENSEQNSDFPSEE